MLRKTLVLASTGLLFAIIGVPGATARALQNDAPEAEACVVALESLVEFVLADCCSAGPDSSCGFDCVNGSTVYISGQGSGYATCGTTTVADCVGVIVCAGAGPYFGSSNDGECVNTGGFGSGTMICVSTDIEV